MPQVLLTFDGQLVWTPNNTLRTQPLVNLSRSNPRFEAYTWLVDLDTPDEVSATLPRLSTALSLRNVPATEGDAWL